MTNYVNRQTPVPNDDYILPHQCLWMFDVLVCPLLATQCFLTQSLIYGTSLLTFLSLFLTLLSSVQCLHCDSSCLDTIVDLTFNNVTVCDECSRCELLSYKADSSTLLDQIESVLSECHQRQSSQHQFNHLIIRFAALTVLLQPDKGEMYCFSLCLSNVSCNKTFDNRVVIDFIKDIRFYSLLWYLFLRFS